MQGLLGVDELHVTGDKAGWVARCLSFFLKEISLKRRDGWFWEISRDWGDQRPFWRFDLVGMTPEDVLSFIYSVFSIRGVACSSSFQKNCFGNIQIRYLKDPKSPSKRKRVPQKPGGSGYFGLFRHHISMVFETLGWWTDRLMRPSWPAPYSPRWWSSSHCESMPMSRWRPGLRKRKSRCGGDSWWGAFSRKTGVVWYVVW